MEKAGFEINGTSIYNIALDMFAEVSVVYEDSNCTFMNAIFPDGSFYQILVSRGFLRIVGNGGIVYKGCA